MGCAVPWWAGLSFAVLEELRGPSGAHTQALVRCLPGLLVEADDYGLLHTWDYKAQLTPKNREVFVQGSIKLCVPYPLRVKAKMQNTLYVSISQPHVHMELDYHADIAMKQLRYSAPQWKQAVVLSNEAQWTSKRSSSLFKFGPELWINSEGVMSGHVKSSVT